MEGAGSFDTVQYCIDNSVPCFTFKMDASKKVSVKWGNINKENFRDSINSTHNGVAIVTGETHFVIDFDELKYNPPEEIKNVLFANCGAVERTPGGYHFWFKVDKRTEHLTSASNIRWDNVEIIGLDIRAQKGICYVAPSEYMKEGETKKYTWMKGDLSTSEKIPDNIFDAINHPENFNNSEPSMTIDVSGEPLLEYEWNNVRQLVDMLSVSRATDYSSWRDVIFCLKNTEYSERMLELCHTFSKKGKNYDYRSVTKKFNGEKTKDKIITIRSLYYWAKQDSPKEYFELKAKDKGIEQQLFLGSNASIADVFYELNPHNYIFSSIEGWYMLQENNSWLATNSKEIRSIPNIMNTIREECRNILIIVMKNQKSDETNANSKAFGDTYKKISSSSFIKGVTDFLQGKYYIKDVEKKFNENRDLLAFNNGVLNTKTFEFNKIAPADYITITTGYDYRAPMESEKANVKDFLQKIFPSNYVLNYVLKAVSTCLTGHNHYEFFHIFTGSGANGKSLLMDLCKIVLGDYFRTLSVSYLTHDNDRKKDTPLPELVLARYTRMLVASEPEERDRFQTASMKVITGNDEINCRGLYGKPVTFVPHFKLWILANDIPKFTKYDNGIERRTRCVHFPTKFVVNPKNENEKKRDDFLKEKIKNDPGWIFGLLGLLVEALQSLNGGILEMPNEVSKFTEDYLLENNPVGAWLKKYYNRTDNRDDMVQITNLYTSFLNDTEIIKTQKQFSEDMKKCNISTRKTSGIVYYYGIVRKETFENDDK